MIFTHHQINFNISQTLPFTNDFRPICNGYSIRNDTSSIFTISSLTPSPAMLEILLKFFICLIAFFITMLRFPNPMIQPFMADRAFATLFTLYTNQFRTPFINHQLFNRMPLHFVSEKNLFWLLLVANICFTLSIACYIVSSSSPP